jgi:hypothetical protein
LAGRSVLERGRLRDRVASEARWLATMVADGRELGMLRRDYQTYVATEPAARECVTWRPAKRTLNDCVALPSFRTTST